MFRADIIDTIGNLSSFEKIAMKQSIGACEKINDLNSGEKINVMAAALFHVENDALEDREYNCCILKTLSESGEIVYMSTGSDSAVTSLFDDDIATIFADMPDDKRGVVFAVKKQSSKNNQGSFIILLPVDYI